MKRRNAFSIVEIIVSIGAFSMIIIVIAVLQVTVFSGNRTSEIYANIDQRSLIILRNFTKELRAAQTPHDGSFLISQADNDSVSFYSDRDGDDSIEQVRYFVESNKLKRGIIVPSGTPLTYNPANEKIQTLISNVLDASPYFIYYGASFDGVSSTAALTQPVNPTDVRVVEIDLDIETGISGNATRSLNTRAQVRNLKSGS